MIRIGRSSSLSDTHAASLTGADTHAASLTGADTHAASLTGADTHAASVANTASVTQDDLTGGISKAFARNRTANTLEQDVIDSLIGTPIGTINAIVRTFQLGVQNDGATASTFTLRIKDVSGGTTLSSVTSASLATNGQEVLRLININLNEAASARRVYASIQRNTASEAYSSCGSGAGCIVDGSLSGADTHAASLTGADTHAASLTGADTHAASLTGTASCSSGSGIDL